MNGTSEPLKSSVIMEFVSTGFVTMGYVMMGLDSIGVIKDRKLWQLAEDSNQDIEMKSSCSNVLIVSILHQIMTIVNDYNLFNRSKNSRLDR